MNDARTIPDKRAAAPAHVSAVGTDARGRAAPRREPQVVGLAAHAEVRQDIQFLRGIAVLAVLLNHSKLVPLSAGYLGVDIFFVISGFLITGNIVRDCDAGRFSFGGFYARRARRLLPAAYCTLVVTTLLAAKVLTEDRWRDFVAQLLGTVTFTANVVLPFQSGYFETAADTKPLLHTWSLSVEEQYYLVAPLLVWWLRPRWRLPVLALLGLLSLALCVALVSTHMSYWRFPDLESQSIAFFMLPTRAWEMLAGSLLAVAGQGDGGWNPARWLKLAALGLLVAICSMPLDSVHPRTDAVAVVLLTALLIAGRGAWLGSTVPVRAIATVGDWSYSLYLVHWPLFALAQSAFLGDVPAAVRAGLVGLSVLLAYLQYRFVEQRFRHRAAGAPTLALRRLAAASVLVAALPYALAMTRLEADPGRYAYLHKRNSGLSAACAAGAAIGDPAACSTSPEPRVALWGDSYAMHLVPGLRALPAIGPSMIQITKAACAPVPGVASLDQNYDAQWAAGCLAFAEQALGMITRMPSVHHVILGSPYSGYLDNGKLQLFVDGRSVSGDRSIALDRLVKTVQRLQAAGKSVTLVAPPPRPGFDIGACHEQRGLGLIVLGRSGCDFAYAEHLRHQAGIIDGLKEVAHRTGAKVVWFDPLLCDAVTCRTSTEDGVSIYKDGGHLSIPGSVWAVRRLALEVQP